MFLSVFKIGVGPSSSHTMGPMLAAARFLDVLRAGDDRVPGSGPAARIEATLHGSLAFTGKGHATDRAVILGLLGCRRIPEPPEQAIRPCIERQWHPVASGKAISSSRSSPAR